MAVISPMDQPRVTVQVPVPTPVSPPTSFAPAFAPSPQQQVAQQTQVQATPGYAQAFAPPQQPQSAPQQQPAPEQDYFTPKTYSEPVAFIFPHSPTKRPKYRPAKMARGETPVRKSADHTAFVKSMVANPQDTTNALVYADYLSEQGDDGAAEVVRRHVGERGTPYQHSRYISGPYGVGVPQDGTPFVSMYPTSYRDGEQDYVVDLNHNDPRNSGTFVSHFTKGSPEEIHQLVSAMPNIHGADRAVQELESRYTWLKKGGPQ